MINDKTQKKLRDYLLDWFMEENIDQITLDQFTGLVESICRLFEQETSKK